jgi:hypothetical protein
MAEDKSTIFDSEGHVYDAQVFSDGVLFTARRPELSLIVRDEERLAELTEVNHLIDELNDKYFETTERIVSMLLGF